MFPSVGCVSFVWVERAVVASETPRTACGSAVVGLEQAEPDFADEGEAGDGVPEPGQGDLGSHGDGGRVDQFFQAGADEGDPEQVTMVLVDDHAGPARVASAVPKFVTWLGDLRRR
jgi:hypothetical protein